MTYVAGDDIARFFSKTERQENGCLLWIAGLHSVDGYGTFCLRGRDYRSHRVAWLIAHGEWPTGYVCHHCDTPRCVEIGHLFVGDQKANMEDCVRKGRFPSRRGAHNGRAKLTPDDIRAIRTVRGVESCVVVGKRYGVAHSQIARIWRGELWAEVI